MNLERVVHRISVDLFMRIRERVFRRSLGSGFFGQSRALARVIQNLFVEPRKLFFVTLDLAVLTTTRICVCHEELDQPRPRHSRPAASSSRLENAADLVRAEASLHASQVLVRVRRRKAIEMIATHGRNEKRTRSSSYIWLDCANSQ